MNIYEKIQQARVELQELGIKQSGHNKFANFQYFELKDFLPKINKIFEKLKLFSKFDLLENEGILTIINSEKTDEIVMFSTPKAEIVLKGQNGLQMIGSTHTYLKRYCYLNALEIVEDDAINATIDKDKNDEPKKKKELTAEEKRIRIESFIAKNTSKYLNLINNFLKIHKAEKMEDLSNEEVLNLGNQIKEKEKKGA